MHIKTKIRGKSFQAVARAVVEAHEEVPNAIEPTFRIERGYVVMSYEYTAKC